VNGFRADRPKALLRIRTELVARLRERRPEIEEAVIASVRTLSEEGDEDPDYVAGLRAAVAESVDYALVTVEHGGESSEPIPSAAAVQARRAARNGVRLDTVMRRYAAGDRVLAEFIMNEAERFPSQALRNVLRAQGSQVDRLMAAVASEYMDELERMRRSPAQRLAERVQRLLSGDSAADAGELGYELDAWHLGFIFSGEKGAETLRVLATALSCQVLEVPRGGGTMWAWLGARRQISSLDIEPALGAELPVHVALAVGEPRRGIEGWRLTHREAQAAFEVMLRVPRPLILSRDVVLLAALLRDEALAKSLRETYLAPLDHYGDSGKVLRETLRAYFAAGLNAATAAAALGVDRHTVQRRLRKVEDALGRLLPSCHAELEVALSLEELAEPASLERLQEAS
jgi:hypothetical protein